MKKEDLLRRFENNMPDMLVNVKHGVIARAAFILASAINKVCPESREKHTAILKTEEAQMWANSAISRMSKQHITSGQETKKTEEKENG